MNIPPSSGLITKQNVPLKRRKRRININTVNSESPLKYYLYKKHVTYADSFFICIIFDNITPSKYKMINRFIHKLCPNSNTIHVCLTRRSRFDPQHRQKDFSSSLYVSRPALEPTQPLFQSVQGGPFAGGKVGPGSDPEHSPHLVQISWMSRKYTSSPPSASMVCNGTVLPFTCLLSSSY
jgi:hypothetical protein